MKRSLKGILCLAAILIIAGGLFMVFTNGEKTVGTNITMDEITEFYYTEDASTYPPRYKGKIQEFSFRDAGTRLAFEDYCNELKARP